MIIDEGNFSDKWYNLHLRDERTLFDSNADDGNVVIWLVILLVDFG